MTARAPVYIDSGKLHVFEDGDTLPPWLSPSSMAWESLTGVPAGITQLADLTGPGYAKVDAAGAWSVQAAIPQADVSGLTTALAGLQPISARLTAIAGLTDAAGWLHDDGSGNWALTTPTKSDVGLSLVENTALSTWGGSTSLTTLGTVASGTWHGTAIADAYISSAAAWNAKEGGLGNPSVSGYLLSSTSTGARSWVAPYSLPTATASVLGGVKVGTGLAIASSVLSVAYGTTAGTACAGNDSRLSDSRTPTAHALDGALHTISGKTAGQVLVATGATTFGFATISGDAALSGAGALTLATLLTAGSAGSAAAVPTLTWDAKGRLTAAGSAAISIPHTQINDWFTATSSFLTANQSISLKGAVTGSGTTSIATSFANSHLAGINQELTTASSPTFAAITASNSYHGVVGIGTADAQKWYLVATVDITDQHGYASAVIRFNSIGGNGALGLGWQFAGSCFIRAKQQSAMSSGLDNFTIGWNYCHGFNPSSAVIGVKTTDNASHKIVNIYLLCPASYDGMSWQIDNLAGFITASGVGTNYVTTLPTGLATYAGASAIWSDWTNITVPGASTFTGLITANGGIKSSGAAALSLTANGSGTYMTSVLYQDASGVYLERGLASESGSASPLPFYISKRGGGTPYPFLVNANDVTTNTMLYANGGISGNLTGTASNASALGGVSADYFVQGQNATRTVIQPTAATSQSQLFKSGFYCSQVWTDAPVASTWTHLIHTQYGNDGGSTNNWSFDIAANFGSAANPGSPEGYYVRAIAAGSSTGWRQLIHSANYPSFNNFTSGLTTTTLTASGLITANGGITGNLTGHASLDIPLTGSSAITGPLISSNASNLGSESLPWGSVYGTTLYEGGVELSSKYLGISASIPHTQISDWDTYINQPVLTTSQPTFSGGVRSAGTYDILSTVNGNSDILTARLSQGSLVLRNTTGAFAQFSVNADLYSPTVYLTSSISGYYPNFNVSGNITASTLSVGNTSTFTGLITANGGITSPQYSLPNLNAAPASSTSTGKYGEIRWCDGYVYLCTATNTWKRAALTTW